MCFSIFEDIGDYIPSTKPTKEKERHRDRDRERDRDDDTKSRRHAYFEKPRGDEHQVMLGGGVGLCLVYPCGSNCVCVSAGDGGGHR